MTLYFGNVSEVSEGMQHSQYDVGNMCTTSV